MPTYLFVIYVLGAYDVGIELYMIVKHSGQENHEWILKSHKVVTHDMNKTILGQRNKNALDGMCLCFK